MERKLEEIKQALLTGNMDPVWEVVFDHGPRFYEALLLLAYKKGYQKVFGVLINEGFANSQGQNAFDYTRMNQDPEAINQFSKYGVSANFFFGNSKFVKWCYKFLDEKKIELDKNSAFKLATI